MLFISIFSPAFLLFAFLSPALYSPTTKTVSLNVTQRKYIKLFVLQCNQLKTHVFRKFNVFTADSISLYELIGAQKNIMLLWISHIILEAQHPMMVANYVGQSFK